MLPFLLGKQPISLLGSDARCPSFASGFCTLTWAEEGEKGAGWPTEYFQLTIPGRPLGFDLSQATLA